MSFAVTSYNEAAAVILVSAPRKTVQHSKDFISHRCAEAPLKSNGGKATGMRREGSERWSDGGPCGPFLILLLRGHAALHPGREITQKFFSRAAHGLRALLRRLAQFRTWIVRPPIRRARGRLGSIRCGAVD